MAYLSQHNLNNCVASEKTAKFIEWVRIQEPKTYTSAISRHGQEFLKMCIHFFISFFYRLVNLIKSQPQEDKPGESLLAGAVAMALCFIAKVSSFSYFKISYY